MSPHADRTSELLTAIVDADETAPLTLEILLARFHRRAFGVLLLLVLLPVFLPVPIGVGALCGPLISLVGLQLALNRDWPWLPKAIRRRPLSRQRLRRFLERWGKWLRRLERLCRPRLEPLLAHTLANVVSGVLLVLLGLLLALPIPLTNYPFGLLILAYALALIERDGALMLLAWALGIATLAGFAGLSSEALVWLEARGG